MVSMKEIGELADRIAREFNPNRIVLFGSYAWGKPTPDSDVDILVVVPFVGKSWKMASEIRKRLRPSFPIDFIVRTPEQLQTRLNLGDDFIRDITNEGKVLYEEGYR